MYFHLKKELDSVTKQLERNDLSNTKRYEEKFNVVLQIWWFVGKEVHVSAEHCIDEFVTPTQHYLHHRVQSNRVCSEKNNLHNTTTYKTTYTHSFWIRLASKAKHAFRSAVDQAQTAGGKRF